MNESFGAKTINFSFYKNQYTDNYDVVDYKDWIVGLGRRNNSLKLYYTFTHYGLKQIREAVESLDRKALILIEQIKSLSQLFEIHAIQYGLVLFKVKGKDGKTSDKLTKSVAARIKNISEGFCTPAEFQGDYNLRIVVGNFHTTQDHINTYFNKIV